MKKFLVLLLILTAFYGQLAAQDTSQAASQAASQTAAEESGSTLTTGKTATLGLEASTAFAWDLANNSTGLATKAGIDFVFPLFPTANRGVNPGNFDDPAVRVVLKDASFVWWNTYSATGGNYEQDNFNSWTARPLVLTFDKFYADLVWTNFFFRVASSTTVMRTDQSYLFSIFDDVMDVSDRWYYRRSATRALWHTERYNIQQFPLLREKIARDHLDDDYRGSISGMLALGAEFDSFNAAIKAASHKNGSENNDNAWLFGADAEILLADHLLISLTGFAGINFEKSSVGKNPLSLGASIEYMMEFSERYILTPQIGFDFTMDTVTSESEWEASAGFVFNTRGYELVSSRILDWDEVIPIGASLSFSLTNDSTLSAMFSWFEPAGKDSMIPNFGGFIQLELANLLSANNTVSAFAVLAQLEYLIVEKFTPYIRGGYIPEFQSGSNSAITGNYFIKGAVGCYITPVHFFSIDVRYEMDMKLLNNGGTESGKSMFSTVFTIRM